MKLNSPIYKKIRKGKYKYELTKEWSCQTDFLDFKFSHSYFSLDKRGALTIKSGYAWDGPSGPTIDTKPFVAASLSHDALYQALREIEGLYSSHRRKLSDGLLKRHCRHFGMSRARSSIAYFFVRRFGGIFSKPKK